MVAFVLAYYRYLFVQVSLDLDGEDSSAISMFCLGCNEVHWSTVFLLLSSRCWRSPSNLLNVSYGQFSLFSYGSWLGFLFRRESGFVYRAWNGRLMNSVDLSLRRVPRVMSPHFSTLIWLFFLLCRCWRIWDSKFRRRAASRAQSKGTHAIRRDIPPFISESKWFKLSHDLDLLMVHTTLGYVSALPVVVHWLGVFDSLI